MIATLVALLLQASALAAPPRGEGWVQGVSEDGKSFVWTLADSGGRGASIVVTCRKLTSASLSITTKEPLLEMADADDGEIKVILVAGTQRHEVDGKLASNFHDVTFDRYAANSLVQRLRTKETVGRELTLILSNNDRREVYSFMNLDGTYEERTLTCGKPKRHLTSTP